jgi:hypothetical protein
MEQPGDDSTEHDAGLAEFGSTAPGPPQVPGKGWYPDPWDASGQALRCWDGEGWTEHVSRPQTPPTPRKPPSLRRVIVLLVLGAAIFTLAIVFAAWGHSDIRQGCRSDLGSYSSVDSCEADASEGVDFISVVAFGAGVVPLALGMQGIARRRSAQGPAAPWIGETS